MLWIKSWWQRYASVFREALDVKGIRIVIDSESRGSISKFISTKYLYDSQTIIMLSLAVPVVFLYLLYTLISIIRVFYYHSLSRIPGPTLWIAFPIFRYISLIQGKQDIVIRSLHQKYGEVVRLAPNEVSFITAQAWRDIYGHGHKQLPKFSNSASNPLDIISSNDIDHSRYRKAMSHAFSAKGLQTQEPMLQNYVDKLITKLEHRSEASCRERV